MYDDADSLFGPSYSGNLVWPLRITSIPETSLKGILKKSTENAPNNNINKGDKLPNDAATEQLVVEKACATHFLTSISQVICSRYLSSVGSRTNCSFGF